MDVNDTNKDKKDTWLDDDELIYIPDELYHRFNRQLLELDMTYAEIRKVIAERKKEQINSQI
jgi:hypothetical protein